MGFLSMLSGLCFTSTILIASMLVYLWETSDFEKLGWAYNRIEKYHTNKEKRNEVDGKEVYDFIVVGSGSSGSVVASRLSENKNYKVLLLEAGGADNDFRVSPLTAFVKMYYSKLDWGYDSVPQENISGNIIHTPRGKTLGGSSSINACIYMRGSAYDYDNWEKLGNKGWGWKDVLPYFKKSEKNLSFKDPKFHGTEGEWIISDGEHPEIQHTLREAVSDVLKIPLKDDVNGEDYATEGSAFSQFNFYEGKRFSVSDAFLNNDVLQRENLYVKMRAHVMRILFDEEDKTKAVGVEVDFRNGSEIRKIYFNKELILSAGSINSPQILMLSGIGDENELKKLDIPVVLNAPDVGKHLHDHITTYILWEPKEFNDSLHSMELNPLNAIKAIYDYWFNGRKGSLRFHSVSLNAVFKSEIAKKNGEEAPDMQYLSGGAAPPYSPRENMSSLYHLNGAITILPCLLQPKSRGTVSLNSSKYNDPPLIDYNTFAVKEDEDRIVDAWKKADALMTNEKFASKINKRIHIESYKDDEDLKKQLHRKYFYMYHPTSTVMMGKVVDERLRVKGIKGLRVIDASIMPAVTRGNTNAPSVMIGEKGADMIIQDHSK